MQQTLLAVSAVVAFAYLALGQQRTEQRLSQRDVTSQVELAAVDLARARVHVVASMAFDEGDVGSMDTRFTPSARPLGPDAGEHDAGDFDDLDDWDGWSAPVSAESGRTRLSFRERVAVRYVRDHRPSEPSAAPTLSKEVVVTVEEVVGDGAERRPARLTLRRVVTPVALSLDHTQ